MPATVLTPAPKPTSIDAKVAASNQAAVDAAAQGAAPVVVEPVPAEHAPAPEPVPMSDQIPAPEPDPASAQAAREVDPSEPHDFLEEGFKRDQSGAHPDEIAPADVVASTDPVHTIGKGLTADGSGANGMVNGDRPVGL